MSRNKTMMDGTEAAAYVAYRVNEVVAIYPITPSSQMAEFADQWSSENLPNIWGTVPLVVEMQSEGGAAGAVHGALQTGSLTTTFTASQGLLLMIPNMYKIAGELTPTVFHVAARSLAAQGLSIFGDHSDVMSTRATGFAMLASGSVQEVMDMAMIAHSSTLKARVPFIHFFDGFRTSHEVNKVEILTDDDIRALIDQDAVQSHRSRGLTPDAPVIRGTAQNPDVYFQGRETVNPFYQACPSIVQEAMDQFASLVGRRYRLFDYYGDPQAERIIVMMGSGAQAAQEAVDVLRSRGEKVGLITVRLYRPFSAEHFLGAIPETVKAIAVLDRTKEPGSAGEPLYIDILTSLTEAQMDGRLPFAQMPRVIGGRYGLSSKEFTPAMVKAVFDEISKASPKNHFTVGIKDDVTFTSLEFDPSFSAESKDTVRAVFFGLGADGTVGANKNSIKIIGEETDNFAQGYFQYDSKKSGTVTTSHLRFGPRPIRSSYLIEKASFVACHQFNFLEQVDMLRVAESGAIFLLNSPFGPDEVWDNLPRKVQQEIIDKNIRLFVVDGYKVAEETGMGRRINTVLQACFFAISGILPREEAIAKIKEYIYKTYGKRGEAVVQQNYDAVDKSVEYLFEVEVPAQVTSDIAVRPPVPEAAPEFVQNVTAMMIAGKGDLLPVSAMPVDGTYPTGTTQWEKRNVALEIPVWDESICIQCGKCVMVCPHATIRSKIYEPTLLSAAPETFKSTQARWKEYSDLRYTLQIAPEDCTGCGLCVDVCPVKNKTSVKLKAINMQPQPPLREAEAINWGFFLSIPEFDRTKLGFNQVKDLQLLQPLFEFSGACAGCGETPYLKLITQLFGDRSIVANATGCSSIFGGNLPTTPWTKNKDGRGPAWSNSLFEDNAEFGLGMRLTLDKRYEYASELLVSQAEFLGEGFVQEILAADQTTEEGIIEQRTRVDALKKKLASESSAKARDLTILADIFVKKSVWIVGGDGWAYDIGYGGLDHVIASGRNVNILVMDTEVYSNTGGQMSKATPRAAVAKFAAGGKPAPKKDLGMLAMTYGNVYVARVALGANDAQTVRAFIEAEAYKGPSLIIAYSHCIAHGYNMVNGLQQQKKAVQSGYWPLFRFNPDLAEEGKNPLQLDSKEPALPLKDYIYNETRYTMLVQSKPEVAQVLLKEAQEDVYNRWKMYKQLAGEANGNSSLK